MRSASNSSPTAVRFTKTCSRAKKRTFADTPLSTFSRPEKDWWLGKREIAPLCLKKLRNRPAVLNSQVVERPILRTTTCRLYVISAISLLGTRCCSSRISLHLVPALDRTTRERALPGTSSSFERRRGACGYFIVSVTFDVVEEH